MTPSRWQQVEELYHAALECEPGQRAAFLTRADPELRREVESLLAQESGVTPLDHPAWEGAASLLTATVAALTPGTQLGPYKIQGPLAAGGMGEVFRAVDTRLGRSVAVKTSREQFSERFNREARAISSLNHPHICTLYDVGPNYLVMELCEGETLAARLKRGKLSIDDTLRYSQQIADALAAAHAKGIVHRDLKPGNIMLGKTGVKVLDFGLAKSSQDETLTGTRVVMGTPAYMAPEQREGKECDARTDIYALGLVLYEMATRKRPVEGQPPPLDALAPQLAHIIERCLVPDPDDRWQSARDVGAELEWAGRSRPSVAGERPRRMWLPWGIAALATLASIGALLYLRAIRQAVPNEHSTRFLVSPPEKAMLSGRTLPVISPDGERLAFGAIEPDGKARLWVRPLSSLTAEPVPGSDGAISVFWSFDSRSLGFFAGGKLKRSDLHGGPPQILCDASDSLRPMGTWNRDGVILFNSADRRGLYRVPATGGEAIAVTTLDASRQENMHAWPQFLPDGRHFIYLSQSNTRENTGIYAGSLDSKISKRLANVSTNPTYAESLSGAGYLLFMQAATLMAQAFDPRNLALQGEAFPVAEQVLLPPAPGRGFAAFSASRNGVLAYRTLGQASTELVWFDRQGKRLGTLGEPANYSVPALSPDEKKLAITRIDAQVGTRDIWLFDLARGTSYRFTFDPDEETNPTWSPDGNRIAFTLHRNIFQKAATGVGNPEPLWESSNNNMVQTWTPDGRFILYESEGKLWTLPLNGDRKPTVLLTGVGDGVTVSPNVKWVAYQAYVSGRMEIFVESFPPSGSKWQVSTTGGAEPYWRSDGKELFFVAGKQLMAVDVNTGGPIFDFGVPKPLFEVRLETESRRSRYQVAADGQKFLVNVPLESTLLAPITVVTNWTAGLKQ
jgi:serine/threonine protein kinase/Tol biopolymer transport system component